MCGDKMCSKNFSLRSKHKMNLNTFNSHKELTAEIPTLSILNLLEDNDDYCPPSTTSVSCSQSNTFLDFAKLPSHDSEILTKLHLKSLTQDSSSGFTPAPANTPLHSSHRLEVLVNQGSEGLPESLQSQSQKQTSLGSSHSPQHSVHNMVLDLRRGEKKKVLQWKARNKKGEGQDDAHVRNKSKNKVASDLILPLETLPVHSHETSWKNTKTKKSLKPINFTNITVPLELSSSKIPSSKRGKSARSDQANTTTQIPREIERLRLVPIDVLLRVVKMALHNKVLTLQQADMLMYQVTGQKYSFYTENTSSAQTLSKTTLYLTSQKKIPVNTSKNSKKAASALNTPIVYKLDAARIEVEKKLRGKQRESRSSSRQKLKPIDEMLLQSYRDGSRSLSPSKLHAPAIKSTVGCVVKTAEETTLSSPIKPFHYQKNSVGMCLHPLPTPPPASPSTERDSNYDEVVGGSTVLVNPPSLANSLATFERPPSGSSFASKKRDSIRDTGYEHATNSSSKSTLWPQIDEGLYLENDPEAVIPAVACSPEIGKVSSPGEENKLPPLPEGSTDSQQTLESSPVPPPPSPVVPHVKEAEVADAESEQEMQS